VYRIAVLASLLATAAVATASAEDYRRLVFNVGGGVSNPLGPTSRWAGVSSNINTGVGYAFNDHSSVIGEFMWSGMPPNSPLERDVNGPLARINLFTLTANYRYKIDKLGSRRFGVYVIGGGGWYYRYTTINGGYVVPPATACQPVFTWWGFTCTNAGFVDATSMTYKFLSTGGLNGGAGFTIRFGESNWKFYTETRYHYAFHRIPTSMLLVTAGFRFN